MSNGDKIVNILDRFDFDKSVAYMTLKDWKVKGRIPDQKKLRKVAIDMLWKSLEQANLHNKDAMVGDLNYGLIATATRKGSNTIFNLYFFIENKQSIDGI